MDVGDAPEVTNDSGLHKSRGSSRYGMKITSKPKAVVLLTLLSIPTNSNDCQTLAEEFGNNRIWSLDFPIEWSARSPDLSPMNFYINNEVKGNYFYES